MKYSATIIAKLDKIAYKSIKLELNNTKRSQVTISEEKDYLKFTIEAKDSVSLRGTLNAITKLFTVYEKLEGIENGE